MKRIFAIMFCLVLLMGLVTAQEPVTISASVNPDLVEQAKEDIGALPTSTIGYAWKRMVEEVKGWAKFNAEEKAQYRLELLAKRVAELEILEENGYDNMVLNRRQQLEEKMLSLEEYIAKKQVQSQEQVQEQVTLMRAKHVATLKQIQEKYQAQGLTIVGIDSAIEANANKIQNQFGNTTQIREMTAEQFKEQIQTKLQLMGGMNG